MIALPPDYHIHTGLCRHANGTPIDLAIQARTIGLEEIGIADHLPSRYLPANLPLDEYTMGPEEIPLYFSQVEEAQRQVQGIRIKVGFEVDYYRGALDRIRGMIEGLELDYLIGSVHVLGDWCIDDERYLHRYEGCDMDALVATYMETLIEAVSTGFFDILGHTDLFKKFGFPVTVPPRMISRLAEVMQEMDMAVEINSGGLRKPCGEAYPGPDFLRAFRERRIPLVFGSDAHRPGEVGWRFAEVHAMAKSAGFTHRAEFSKRKRILVPL